MKLTLKQQTIFEITVVLGTMLLVKDILDRFNAIGAGSIAMWTGILLATFFMKKQGRNWRELGLTLPKSRKALLSSLGQALLAIVIVIAFMGLVQPIISELLGVSIPKSSTDRFEFLLGKPLAFVTYLVVVIWIGAALGEELLMRGFLLNKLISIMGDERKGIISAVVVHAVIFGILHISQGIPGILSTGCVAILFAIVYLRNGRNLFPLILAHGVINSIGLLGYYLTDGAMT
ncbi:MAG: CPBP family intramembrane metalloprotease [Thalassotalea sp.]|nr:CPBP family intramembrane metalloprotease [Thalassotalea sp.]